MRSRVASAALAVTLLGGAAVPAAVLGVPVAAAHAVLLASDPEDGATLEAAPERVTLSFNEEINPSFVTVAVTGADRTDHVRGEATVEGEQVSAGIGPLDDGEYTVGYRVTSADGHVITGSTRFAVGSPGTTAGAGDGGSDPGPTATDASTAEVTADDSATTGVSTAVWVVGGLAVVLVGAAVFLLRRGGDGTEGGD
ncbi:copper resistance protein CopC [Dietzia sp. 179-F 9C3 NHS]|uniref:copper resistance protein CopC n=1 Tax=Dietzia sp. 179-F 9C3 NHS TaxID=3374295 RepID=UPI00387A2704